MDLGIGLALLSLSLAFLATAAQQGSLLLVVLAALSVSLTSILLALGT